MDSFIYQKSLVHDIIFGWCPLCWHAHACRLCTSYIVINILIKLPFNFWTKFHFKSIQISRFDEFTMCIHARRLINNACTNTSKHFNWYDMQVLSKRNSIHFEMRTFNWVEGEFTIVCIGCFVQCCNSSSLHLKHRWCMQHSQKVCRNYPKLKAFHIRQAIGFVFVEMIRF